MSEFKIPAPLEELRALPQWVVATADKVPRNPRDGGRAAVDDPSTWGTFEQAAAYADKHGLRVGFVFTDADPFTGIDLDNKPERPVTPSNGWSTGGSSTPSSRTPNAPPPGAGTTSSSEAGSPQVSTAARTRSRSIAQAATSS
jgi:hypothetical protein